MSSTQGVILVLVGVLILYLIWARGSPLNQPAPGSQPTGGTTPRDGQPIGGPPGQPGRT